MSLYVLVLERVPLAARLLLELDLHFCVEARVGALLRHDALKQRVKGDFPRIGGRDGPVERQGALLECHLAVFLGGALHVEGHCHVRGCLDEIVPKTRHGLGGGGLGDGGGLGGGGLGGGGRTVGGCGWYGGGDKQGTFGCKACKVCKVFSEKRGREESKDFFFSAEKKKKKSARPARGFGSQNGAQTLQPLQTTCGCAGVRLPYLTAIVLPPRPCCRRASRARRLPARHARHNPLCPGAAHAAAEGAGVRVSCDP